MAECIHYAHAGTYTGMTRLLAAALLRLEIVRTLPTSNKISAITLSHRSFYFFDSGNLISYVAGTTHSALICLEANHLPFSDLTIFPLWLDYQRVRIPCPWDCFCQ